MFDFIPSKKEVCLILFIRFYMGFGGEEITFIYIRKPHINSIYTPNKIFVYQIIIKI